MRGTGNSLIGVDRHPPSSYPLPGQWMSPHHRVVSEDKKQALERDYIGLDTAVHRQNLEMYRGTGDYLPMAKWLGSLRNNSEYRQHLEGAPPGVAEASGVRMVQPPMHYTNASSVVRHGHFPGEVGGGGPSSPGSSVSDHHSLHPRKDSGGGKGHRKSAYEDTSPMGMKRSSAAMARRAAREATAGVN